MAVLIYLFIKDHQGITAYGLAKAFKISYIKVQDELAYLNDVCEDDDGHLFTCEYAWKVYNESVVL